MRPTIQSATTLLLLFLAATIEVGNAAAQNPVATIVDLPPTTLALSDLTGLRAVAGTWKIVGGTVTDGPNSAALVSSRGTGVLVNSASGAPVSTTWEHGDLDLSFDVMLAKGSMSMVLLMGRYGVQLTDSRTSSAASLGTIGAVAPRLNDVRGPSHEAFEGTIPLQNAARAPGLWQHVDIVFRAPRFSMGQKVSNARFAKVTVNGVVVQENVQVTGPTQGATWNDERATGPLVIEDVRGALALRNVRYKSYTGSLALTGLRYRVYEGDAMDASYARTHAPLREGTAIAISANLPTPQDKFAVTYEGNVNAPAAGNYRFTLLLGWIGGDAAARGPSVGGGTLTIDGKTVVMHNGAERRSSGDVELTPGPHAFAVSYYKNRASYNRHDVSVMVEGPGVERQSLSEDSGGGGGGFGAPVNPIMVEPQSEPVVLRSFIRHRNTKRVIAASVADPRGVHYTYDLAQGSLLYVWRGPFLETTQMWHERGEDQTAEPLGSVVTLPGTPTVAYLADVNAAWPDSVDEKQFRRDGYVLEKSGHPTFLAHLRGAAIEDALRPDADGLSLHRELRIHAPSSGVTADRLYVQLAQADHITRQGDGLYVVGDRNFYITLHDAAQPILRRSNGLDELLIPVQFTRGAASVAYSIVW
ncbi:MAG: DUF1080 domain-containing protein [Gemmatimonadota bacterium]|nr:DUF1080 domain-containing protein [Gemmatimonadota bacterium]